MPSRGRRGLLATERFDYTWSAGEGVDTTLFGEAVRLDGALRIDPPEMVEMTPEWKA